MIEKLTLKTPGNDATDGNSFEINPIQNQPTGGLSDLQSIISWGTTVLLFGATVLAIFLLIFAGIQWITSGGNKEKVQTAQKKIIWTIIGLVVIFSSFMIISIIGSLVEVDFFG